MQRLGVSYFPLYPLQMILHLYIYKQFYMSTVDYRQIANDNIANQIHGFAIDYGKFILISDIPQF